MVDDYLGKNTEQRFSALERFDDQYYQRIKEGKSKAAAKEEATPDDGKLFDLSRFSDDEKWEMLVEVRGWLAAERLRNKTRDERDKRHLSLVPKEDT